MLFNDNSKIESKNNKFLKTYNENDKFNQYWFSEKTIEFIVQQIEKYAKDQTIAFVSTPSVFFSVSNEFQQRSVLFDYDVVFEKKTDKFVKYDYLDQSIVPDIFNNYFDYIIVDPPFINEEAWTKYSEFVKRIGKSKDGVLQSKVITCSIEENKNHLEKILGLKIQKYKPSIPHLVYQYNFYANYEDPEFDKKNPEIIE